MTRETLYSLRTDGDQYRITKIVDGEVESSYLSTERECECPAGHRPMCRHRQMIPEMLARGICDTHWFWNFDLHRVVDFNGMLKSNYDQLAVVGEAQHTEAVELASPAIAVLNKSSWRRL